LAGLISLKFSAGFLPVNIEAQAAFAEELVSAAVAVKTVRPLGG